MATIRLRRFWLWKHSTWRLIRTPIPEQLEQGLEIWKTRRIFWNGSAWWDKTLPDKVESDPDWISLLMWASTTHYSV